MKNLLSLLLALCTALPVLAQTPVAPAPNGQAAPPASTSSPAAKPPLPPPPQAQNQAEFDAYQTAAAESATAAMQEEVDKFVAAYPQSELRGLLYQRLMERYYRDGNGERALAAARALLALEPDNPAALARSATVLSESSAPGDVTGNERLMEAQKNAQRLVNTLDRTIDMLFQADTLPDQRVATRRVLMVLAYSALGKACLEL